MQDRTGHTGDSSSNSNNDNKGTNLFQECVSFWGASIVAPTTTNLRILARKGLLSDEADAPRILTLPVTLDVVMEIFIKNQDTMLKHFADDNGIPFHIETIGLYKKHVQNPENAKLVIFEDDCCEEELVYAIIVNAKTKRTYLSFRGSVTKRDYEADMNVRMREMEDHQGNVVRVHRGFSEYLFGSYDDEASATKHGGNNDAISLFCKYDEIVQSLLGVCEEYQDHELCVTGHSLGGSLSILSAHRLAVEKKLEGKFRGPVLSFGFGSLLVGDLKFLRSVQSLERDGLLRSINIMNEGDIIPLLPFSSGLAFYRGAGRRVIISKNKKPKAPIIYFPPEPWSCCPYDRVSIPGLILPRFFFVLCCRRRFWENHTVETTTECIFTSKKFLESLSVERLYNENGTRGLPWKIRSSVVM
mmetsp:Transcript_29556/g.55414  ORF Transcript_29556/g.55414 Transcript_29556/m.55414 type:complete len:415 (-) Transcript_29556:64-1308(-)